MSHLLSLAGEDKSTSTTSLCCASIQEAWSASRGLPGKFLLQRLLQGERGVQGARVCINCPAAGRHSPLVRPRVMVCKRCGQGRLFPSRDVPTGSCGGERVTYGRFTPLRRDSQAPPLLFLVPCSLLGYIPCPPTLHITARAYSAVNSPFSNQPQRDEQYNRRLMD